MKIAIALALLALSGCATNGGMSNVDRLSLQARVRDTIPTCSSDKECLNKWEAAQFWVSNNSGYKIQTATSAIIETYNATGGSVALAMKVLKEPLGNGQYRMVMSARCDNMFGCQVEPLQAIQNFNDYVNTIK